MCLLVWAISGGDETARCARYGTIRDCRAWSVDMVERHGVDQGAAGRGNGAGGYDITGCAEEGRHVLDFWFIFC